MGILKLSPATKDYLWGGLKLKEKFNKEYDGEILAETWELSCHIDGMSIISNIEDGQTTLQDYITKNGKEVLGTNCAEFEEFPILVKFIDAKDNLSIQVHPDDEYALKNEGQYGKTEMWYILDCEEGAFLYYGFTQVISKDEFRERIENDTILDVLNKVEVKKGDVFFIEPGTIHAIGAGITLAEIQQSSNLTYRVYDFGRTDKDGNKRELHIEKALEVTGIKKAEPKIFENNHLAECKYFTVDKVVLDGQSVFNYVGVVDETSFLHLLVVDGAGKITCGQETLEFTKGDSLFLPANSGEYELTGICEALCTYLVC